MSAADSTTCTSIYSLLECTATDLPDQIAIEFQGQSINYAELAERSRRLATALHNAGAEPGQRVAFCFNKSIDAIVTLFAIARTGAAYVPVDPAWPVTRLAMIRQSAGFNIWTGSNEPPRELGDWRARFVSQPKETDSIPIAATVNETAMLGEVQSPSGDIANILYTSGSTGTPKGVQITGRSLLHFSEWGVNTYGVTREDRLANHAPYNFDLSTFDIFAAVRAGATLCPISERLRMFPFQLAQEIARLRITTWYSVPSALALLIQRGKLSDHDLSALRNILFAGEVMPKPLLKQIAAAFPNARLANLYGPTETNVCTWHDVTADDLSNDGPLPIGRAIDDTRLWLADENCGANTRATEGELLVSGPTVTTGYYGDPELTAKRLVPAPDGNGIAYRTGDLCRRDDNGVLFFLGRLDRMIKSRGHRIEPGEIESALEACPMIREAAVVPVPDETFGQRIKACVVFRDSQNCDQSSLIEFCRGRLPSYMVPDEWETWENLPRTDRGKVDLTALIASNPSSRA